MKVILSIKPKYAHKILEGKKTYELRKNIFKNSEIKTVLIYASAPISKIIGEFQIDNIVHLELEELWNTVKEKAEVDRDFFDEYFETKAKGYAISIKDVKKYKNSIDISEKYGIKAPQSFAYVK
ncbi:ASCH domain-containing protein [Empedobacter brevis]|uniref:ASCH domain-containing protein n=1 Tax=Empedobacter brevis TaxID=247 RepID=UPI0028D86382|nr:ASCH domain-containing protein [Empedobacter brevis]